MKNLGIFRELGIDAIGDVCIRQENWHATALDMIEMCRRQVNSAFRRVITERQEQALTAELERMANLERYVRVCQQNPSASTKQAQLMAAALAGASWDELQAMRAELTKPLETKAEGSGSPAPYVADDSALPEIFFRD